MERDQDRQEDALHRKKGRNMQQQIKTISLSLPYRLGSVNCYLIEAGAGFVLVDTGCSNGRARLARELEGAGCTPGDLQLVVITHGDFDHTGNCAFLREKFGTKVAMHPDDSGMVERGDMYSNRESGNVLIRMMTPRLFRFGKSERFVPDLYVEEGYDLTNLGWDAKVLSIPGHSKGSIGILTADGDLFCGDLLANTDEPALNSIMDDLGAAKASVDKLRNLEIRTVYPGHGEPFAMDLFLRSHLRANEEE
jgi:hydroxyacylglutathione hydrolase